MLKSVSLFKLRRGVTLVELLVVIFIFSILIVIISTVLVQGFMTGRLHSSATKDINRELNSATILISQKMTNANYKKTIGTTVIPGFTTIGSGSDSILAIASVMSNTEPQCTFFGVHDKGLYMKQKNCSDFTSVPIVAELDRPITTGITKIIGFELSGYSYNSSTPTIAPYVTVKITGEDTSRTKAKVTLEQTYSLTYPYEKNTSW